MTELQKQSQKARKEADALMGATGLLGVLKKYGAVRIRGSYELDLMIDGDIDVYVIDENFSKERAVRCLNELLMQNEFRGFMFYDFVSRRKKGFPKGYYLGLKTRYRSRKWKVDVWFLKTNDNVSDRFMKKIIAGLNPENRELILQLKKMVKDQNIGLPSFLIYEAVVDSGVSDIDGLRKFALGRGF